MGLPCGTFSTRPQQDMATLRTKTQWFLAALGLIFLFTLALYLPMDWLTWLITLGIFIVAVLGLHVLTGLCGQFSMGHAAFMLIGAYAAAMFGTNAGLPAWATLPLSGILAGVVGLIFGAPALRIKGFYLVMSTIAAQFIITWVVREADADWGWLPSWLDTGGVYGISVPPIVLGGKTIGYVGYWWITLSIVVVMILFAKNLQRTGTGRQFIAVRDNDLAAEVMGINLFRTKLLAFFIGCFFAGIAGWLWAHFVPHISTSQFDFQRSLIFLGMIIVGGMGSTSGAVLGATMLQLTDRLVDYMSDSLSTAFPSMQAQIAPAMSLMVWALVVMFFVMMEPRGLSHTFERFKLYYRFYPFSY
jgi:branched-chain amino acid transport system permease protein